MVSPAFSTSRMMTDIASFTSRTPRSAEPTVSCSWSCAIDSELPVKRSPTNKSTHIMCGVTPHVQGRSIIPYQAELSKHFADVPCGHLHIFMYQCHTQHAGEDMPEKKKLCFVMCLTKKEEICLHLK